MNRPLNSPARIDQSNFLLLSPFVVSFATVITFQTQQSCHLYLAVVKATRLAINFSAQHKPRLGSNIRAFSILDESDPAPKRISVSETVSASLVVSSFM